MQFIALLALCLLCHITLSAVKKCDKVTYLIFIGALVFYFHVTPFDQILTTTMHLSKVCRGTK